MRHNKTGQQLEEFRINKAKFEQNSPRFSLRHVAKDGKGITNFRCRAFACRRREMGR